MLNELDYKELILKLKRHFGVINNKELALKLGMSEDGIKNWTRKKEIPQRYLKLLNSGNDNQIINNNNGNNVKIENNHGHININSSDEMSMEICKSINRLSEKRKEYYYHLIKADLLKEEIEK